MASSSVQIAQIWVNKARKFEDFTPVFQLFTFPDVINDAPIHVVFDGKFRKRAEGKDVDIKYPGGKDAGRYELWEVDDIVTSHKQAGGTSFVVNEAYPEGVQERKYDSDKDEGLKVVLNAGNLDPEYLVNNNPDLVNGPPVVTKDGIVLGGNSRAMSLSVAYAQHPKKAEAYRAYLSENSNLYGLRPGDVKSFKKPVLVRVVDADFSTAEMAQMSRRYNQSSTQGMDEIADGISRSKFISPGTLDLYTSLMDAGDYNTMREFLGSAAARKFVAALRDDGVIEESKVAIYLDKTRKNLTESGKALIESVLRGRVLPDYDMLSNVPKGILNKIDKAIASLAYIHSSGGEKWGITEKLNDALSLCIEFEKRKESGKLTVDSFLKKSEGDLLATMTEGQREGAETKLIRMKSDPQVRDLFMLFQKGTQTKIRDVFKAYATEAKKSPSGEGSLLANPPKPKNILHDLIEKALTSKESTEPKEQENLIAESASGDHDLRGREAVRNALERLQKIQDMDDIYKLLFSLFGNIGAKKGESLYEKLVNGEFDSLKPLNYMVVLERVYREIKGDIERVKKPFKRWIILHEDWLI